MRFRVKRNAHLVCHSGGSVQPAFGLTGIFQNGPLWKSLLFMAAAAVFFSGGWGKVGFTVTGTDRKGSLVYIGGPRGAIERNAVRYYLAIQSFMDTLRHPEERRISMRMSEWYDLTMRYRKQLFELEKKDYLMFKAKEHRNQTALQRSVGPGLR